jgi:succinate dehydrogenase / fumarate reductase, cytochrome b subunit
VSAISRFSAVIAESLVYRGREGQWAYLVHRVAGLGVVLFLALHIFDIYLLGFGPDVFNALLFLYKGPAARVIEVLLLFGLLFHGLNGLRIIVQDFFPALMRHHKRLFYIEVVIFTIVFLPAATMMLNEFFGIVIGFVVAVLLWALVPLAYLSSYAAPPPLNLNVGEAGGGK